RDLIDFFAKARLGSRGLIIIAQGQSDIFIQSAPQGRREMIEEILGLREYQIKKSDAERRLKNSEINLDKVRALIEEILPHLRSLRRQTSKWEKREELEEELKDLENKFFGSQLYDLGQKLESLDKKLGEERETMSVLEREKKAALAKQSKIESGQPEGRRDLQKIKEDTRLLLEKKNQLQKEFGRLEAQIEILSSRAASGEESHSAEKILEFIRDLKKRLEIGAESGGDDLRDIVRKAISDIDSFVSGKMGAGAGGIPEEIKSRFEKINSELGSLDGEITSLKDKEGELEKGQEEFYIAFKSAVAEVESVKDKIEERELKNREGLFEKERLEIKRGEIVHQIRQAGRDHADFEKTAEASAYGDIDMNQAEKRMFKLRGDLASMGEIDEALMKEAKETEERYEFLKKESSDLEKAVKDLRGLIRDLSEKIRNEFDSSLDKINEEFNKFFNLMFGGGRARLKIVKEEVKKAEKGEETEEEGASLGEKEETEDEETEEEKESGIEIDLKLPHKKINSLEMLSGGERSLVGIAALFALISVSPPPFLVLDEIDAALDERNSRRFSEMLREFSKKSQFIVVTHNRATMEVADVLYGVTLSDDGTSKILSLKLES
ncbi:MAG: AAA family ATPase, partial [Patescibacteria group bacterium]